MGFALYATPLITLLCKELPPRGKPLKEALIYNFKRFATIRDETPCGCVTKRAMPVPPRGRLFLSQNT